MFQSILDVVINIGLLILLLGVLVMIHEFGHFIAALIVGAKVEEFSIGFGPKLLSKKIGDTDFLIKILPLGGYVKILGEGDEVDPDADRKKSFKTDKSLKSKKPWQKIFVMLAGVTMNISLAIFLFYVLLSRAGFAFYLPQNLGNIDLPFGKVVQEKLDDIKYTQLVDGGNAQLAGLPSQGIIKTMNGEAVELTSDMRNLINHYKGQVVSIVVCDYEYVSCIDYSVSVSQEAVIGIHYYDNYVYKVQYTQSEIPFSGFLHIPNQLVIIGQYLDMMFDTAKETGNYKDVAIEGVSSPIALYFVVDSLKSEGIWAFFDIMANISFSLAVVNVLPIPALDGGRVIFIIIEAIRKKELDPRLEALIIQISFLIMMLIMVLVVLKDIIFIKDIGDMFK